MNVLYFCVICQGIAIIVLALGSSWLRKRHEQIMARMQHDIGLLERQVLALRDKAHVHHGSTREYL